MLTSKYKKYILNFKQPAGTSRGVLKTKETFFIEINDGNKSGIGECSVFRGLSYDDKPDYEDQLVWLCKNINIGEKDLLKHFKEYPSIQFGIEMAFLDINSETNMVLFPSSFTNYTDSININGLIWMGNEDFMLQQLSAKLEQGFNCIKMKIGAIDFENEITIIKKIRNKYSSEEVEIRVDANGAFTPNEAMEKLKILSELKIHSIEQPIKQGNIGAMAKLCKHTPLDIALDEELIGVIEKKDKEELIKRVKPQYIILKPSLVGGISGSNEWIEIAEKHSVKWWITSALESNIGLNAIAQWTFSLKSNLPQGLGTGSLFTNNIESPLEVKNGRLFYNNSKKWKGEKLEGLSWKVKAES